MDLMAFISIAAFCGDNKKLFGFERSIMSNLKNPFGLRDGSVIMIEDISPHERGLRCNCVCPNCKGPFKARLGEIRAHHFAHSGDSCDEEIAYLTGLYKLVQEIILEDPVLLPELKVYWPYSVQRFTEKSLLCQIAYAKTLDNLNETVVFESVPVKFDSAEIVYAGKQPDALLLSYRSRPLAIRIKPPDTACKTFLARPYESIATLFLDASSIPYGELKKNQILKLLRGQLQSCAWIYSPRVSSALDRINQKNDVWIKHKREQSVLAERDFRLQTSFHDPSNALREQRRPIQNRDAELERGRREVVNLFTQQHTEIYDSFGQRWVQCTQCGEIKPTDEFSDYGGRNRVNSGICRRCSRTFDA